MRAPLTVAALLVLLAWTPTGLAQPSDVLFTAQGGDDCPQDRSYCFGVEGELATIEPGQALTVTVDNRGGTVHNLFVVALDQADPGSGRTSPSTAVAGTGESLSPGQSATFTFTVPADASGLYFWCEITGHERLGMWVSVNMDSDSVQGAAEPASADDQRGAPALSAAAAVALLGAVARLRQRA